MWDKNYPITNIALLLLLTSQLFLIINNINNVDTVMANSTYDINNDSNNDDGFDKKKWL